MKTVMLTVKIARYMRASEAMWSALRKASPTCSLVEQEAVKVTAETIAARAAIDRRIDAQLAMCPDGGDVHKARRDAGWAWLVWTRIARVCGVWGWS